MKYDLKDITFTIPLSIESADRMRNVIASILYLVRNFDTNIIVEEYAEESLFPFDIIEEHLGRELSEVNYIFKEKNTDFFYITKIKNDMIVKAKTKYIYQYDCDVILPVDSYIKSRDLLKKGYDMIYPFGIGDFYCPVYFNLDEGSEQKFIETSDIEYLKKCASSGRYTDFGFCRFYNKQSYIDNFMENENYFSYAPCDKEVFYRFEKLGLKIGRVNNYVYHMEHSRGNDSEITNPYYNYNIELYNKILGMNKEEIQEYFSNQKYYQKRLHEINNA
jgi:hypothetical protein